MTDVWGRQLAVVLDPRNARIFRLTQPLRGFGQAQDHDTMKNRIEGRASTSAQRESAEETRLSRA
jgi:hypothetical protein